MFDLIIGTIKSVADIANKVLSRIWGTQTSEEASLERRAEKAAEEKHAALDRLREAADHGNTDDINRALDDINNWSAELKRVHAEAAAKRI